MSSCFSIGAFLWHTTAAGAIAQSAWARYMYSVNGKSREKGVQCSLAKWPFGMKLWILLFRPYKFLAALAASSLTARMS
eukprot:scaffold126385_cov21-Tisochrysis_lutea.AAC.1